MNLGLEIAMAARGRKSVESVVITSHRPLTEEDAYALMESDEKTTAPNHRKRLRTRHHEAARLMAEGKSDTEINLFTGLQPSTISVLRKDPAFKELVAHYNTVRDEKFETTHERLAALGTDAIEVIHDRLDEKPEDFDNDQLIGIIKTTTDRTGYGPSSKQQVNVNIGIADKLQRAREAITARKTLNLGAEDVTKLD
jgi:hypothetical protein